MYSCSGNSTRRRRSASASRSKFSRWLRYGYIRLVRINDSPQKVAAGLAVGVLLGILPTFGFGALIALALAIVFKFNKAASIFGSLIMNPLTTAFFWTASSVLGAFVANRDWHRTLKMVQSFSANFRLVDLTTPKGWALILKGLGTGIQVYLVGNVLLALFFATLSYLVALHITKAYRERRRLKSGGDSSFQS